MEKSAPQYKKTLKESLASLEKIQTNISAATREVEKVEMEVSEQHAAVVMEMVSLTGHLILLRTEQEICT